MFTDTGIRFRHSGLLECASCECELLVRDLWHRVGSRGLKVMVVPTVRLAYSLKEFEQVERFLRAEYDKKCSLSAIRREKALVDFIPSPPESIECCGMEFANEQLLNFDMQSTMMPWQWWYSVSKSNTRSLSAIITLATRTFRRDCDISLDWRGADDSGSVTFRRKFSERTLHFIIDSDDPTKIPHMAFAHMLEWSRLNPCYRVQVHNMDSFVKLAYQTHAEWGELATRFVDIQDITLGLTENSHRRRMLSLIVLYAFGGIVADLEVLPIQPISPHFHFRASQEYEASFTPNSFGGGPCVIAAPVQSKAIAHVVNEGLFRSSHTPSVVRRVLKGTQYTNNARAALTEASSWIAGRELFHVLGKPKSSVLDNIVETRGHRRMLDGLARTSVTRLGHDEILSDGEFLLASKQHKYSRVIWQSKSTIDGTHESYARDYYALLNSAKRRQSAEGCLEIISETTGFVVWKKCWERSLELGKIVYLAFESGSIRVYASTLTNCSAPPNRQILWSTIPMGQPPKRTFCIFRCSAYALQLTNTGVLQSVEIRTHRLNKLFRAKVMRQRCALDDFESPECNSNAALSTVRRQLVRYRHGCSTVH